jgi:hypothetical protein
MVRRIAATDEELVHRRRAAPPSRAAAAQASASEPLHAEAIRALQQSVGNSAVARLLSSAPVAGGRPLQRDDVTTTSINETTDTGNKYTQDLVLNKTTNRVTVQLGINWVKTGTWADDATFQRFVRRVKSAFYGYADNKFKVVCKPTAPGAGSADIELPIDFMLFDWSSGYTINAHGGTPGGNSAMAQAGGDVFEIRANGTAEEDITYAHEFGHAALGASDEYANPAVPGRVLTNDHSIMANYYAQGKAAAEFKARHFQHIATEVAKAFAGYTCSIKAM